MKVALVMTVRNPGPVLLSSLAYHRKAGFDPIFLFFDDCADPTMPLFRNLEGVSVIPTDLSLRTEQKKSRLYPLLEERLSSDVLSRQLLNTDTAIAWAREQGLDWIMHLDGDELFHAGGRSVQSVLADVPEHVGQVVFLNQEAAPHKPTFDDYFHEVKRFKRNPRFLPQEEKDRYFSLTSRNWYFLGYTNGKSAARVSAALAARNVHLFVPGLEHPVTEVWDESAVILHYLNCGYESFLEKFALVPADTKVWFDHIPGFEFYQQARKLVREGRPGAIRRFYDAHVLFEQEPETHSLLEAGLFAEYPTV